MGWSTGREGIEGRLGGPLEAVQWAGLSGRVLEGESILAQTRRNRERGAEEGRGIQEQGRRGEGRLA